MGRSALARQQLQHVFGGPVPLTVVRGFGMTLLADTGADDPQAASKVAMADDLLRWAKEAGEDD